MRDHDHNSSTLQTGGAADGGRLAVAVQRST